MKNKIITITKETEKENELERLKRKFNNVANASQQSPDSSVISILQQTTHHNIKNIKNLKSEKIIKQPKSIQNIEIKRKNPKAAKLKLEPKLSSSSVNLSDTERIETNNRVCLNNFTMNENGDSSITDNSLTMIEDRSHMRMKSCLSLDEIPSDDDQIVYDKTIYNEKVKNVRGVNIKNSLSKDTEEFPDENDYKNNKIFTREMSSDSMFRSYSFKKNSMFVNNPSWILSSRLINDEIGYSTKRINKNKNFKFFEQVREENHNAIFFRTERFTSMPEDVLYTILSFEYSQYNNIINCNYLIARKICLTLNKKFERVITEFRSKYSAVLELQEYYFKQSDHKKGKQIISTLDLVLKSKIVSSLINKCAEITFTHLINGKDYIQTWSFDLKSKSDIAFWFASEAEEYGRRIVRYCYYQPIVAFCKDDFIEFHINIFSHVGNIDPDSIQWQDLNLYTTPIDSFVDYEKSLIKSSVVYDPIRCCELENVIHVWKNEKSLTKKDNIEEFKNYFKNYFKILNVDYDLAKFFIFKIKMIASNQGTIKKNKFMNVDIEIKPYEECITNETQCLGLLNINHLKQKVQIRVSTYVIFYFTDLYI